MGFFSEPFRIAMRRADRKTFKIPKIQWSRAATTPLVKEVFEMFFPEQLDKDESKVSTEQFTYSLQSRAVKYIFYTISRKYWNSMSEVIFLCVFLVRCGS